MHVVVTITRATHVYNRPSTRTWYEYVPEKFIRVSVKTSGDVVFTRITSLSFSNDLSFLSYFLPRLPYLAGVAFTLAFTLLRSSNSEFYESPFSQTFRENENSKRALQAFHA